LYTHFVFSPRSAQLVARIRRSLCFAPFVPFWPFLHRPLQISSIANPGNAHESQLKHFTADLLQMFQFDYRHNYLPRNETDHTDVEVKCEWLIVRCHPFLCYILLLLETLTDFCNIFRKSLLRNSQQNSCYWRLHTVVENMPLKEKWLYYPLTVWVQQVLKQPSFSSIPLCHRSILSQVETQPHCLRHAHLNHCKYPSIINCVRSSAHHLNASFRPTIVPLLDD